MPYYVLSASSNAITFIIDAKTGLSLLVQEVSAAWMAVVKPIETYATHGVFWNE
jgi:hypothetical protein